MLQEVGTRRRSSGTRWSPGGVTHAPCSDARGSAGQASVVALALASSSQDDFAARDLSLRRRHRVCGSLHRNTTGLDPDRDPNLDPDHHHHQNHNPRPPHPAAAHRPGTTDSHCRYDRASTTTRAADITCCGETAPSRLYDAAADCDSCELERTIQLMAVPGSEDPGGRTHTQTQTQTHTHARNHKQTHRNASWNLVRRSVTRGVLLALCALGVLVITQPAPVSAEKPFHHRDMRDEPILNPATSHYYVDDLPAATVSKTTISFEFSFKTTISFKLKKKKTLKKTHFKVISPTSKKN